MKSALLVVPATLLALAAPAAAAPQKAAAPPPGLAAPKPTEQVVEDIVAWVNDDIVTYSELREQEQQAMQRLLQENRNSEDLSRRVNEVREQMLLTLISNRLMVQEAERLYDVNEVKKDLIKRFRDRQKIKSDEEFDKLLAGWGLTRQELEERLLLSSAPDYVVDMQVMRNLGVSEEDARRHYAEHQDQFTTPASVVFREIVFVAADPAARARRRGDAERILQRARAGEDFVKLVREASEAPSRSLDGRIGPLRPSELVASVANATTTVPVGQVSDLVETPGGWHIVKVEERVDAKSATFDEVRAEVENQIRQAKFGPALETYVRGLWKGSTVEVRKPYADRIPATWREFLKIRD